MCIHDENFCLLRQRSQIGSLKFYRDGYSGSHARAPASVCGIACSSGVHDRINIATPGSLLNQPDVLGC